MSDANMESQTVGGEPHMASRFQIAGGIPSPCGHIAASP